MYVIHPNSRSSSTTCRLHGARSLLTVMPCEIGIPASSAQRRSPFQTRQMPSLPGTNFLTRQKVLPAMRLEGS